MIDRYCKIGIRIYSTFSFHAHVNEARIETKIDSVGNKIILFFVCLSLHQHLYKSSSQKSFKTCQKCVQRDYNFVKAAM